MVGFRLEFLVLKIAICGYGIDQFSNHSYQVNICILRGYYTERDAARIVRQMLKMISKCHDCRFVHRYLRYLPHRETDLVVNYTFRTQLFTICFVTYSNSK